MLEICIVLSLVFGFGFLSYVAVLVATFLRHRPGSPGDPEAFDWHFVIPCRDEAAVIGDTLDYLRSAFPAARVWVVDDASADATADIVAAFAEDDVRSRVHLVRRVLPDARIGKGDALNAAYAALCASVPPGADRERILLCVVDADGRPSENLLEVCAGSDWYDHTLMYHPEHAPTRDVYVSPHCKTQGNYVFTFDYWAQVVHYLVDAGLSVTVGYDGQFCEDLVGHPLYQKHWGDHRQWMEQVCCHRLVACGNTGTGWLAAACGVPLITMEPHNSVISVVARLGLVGGAAWLWLQAELFRAAIRAYRDCNASGRLVEGRLILLIVAFAVLTLASCFGEDTMEKPYNAIPYYLLWGAALRVAHNLRQASNAASAERYEMLPSRSMP